MTTIKRRSSGPLTTFACGALLIALFLLQPAAVKAQWTTPDANQNINNTNTGNVGIGTTTPTSLLEVKKSQSAGTTVIVDNPFTTASNSAYSGLFLKQAGANRLLVSSVNDNHGTITPGTAQFWNFANAPTVFATNNTEQMRLSATGFLGIGTSSPDVRLQVHHSSANTNLANIQLPDLVLALRNTSNTNGNMTLISFQDAAGYGNAQFGVVQKDQTNHSADMVFLSRNGATFGERMRIRSDGNVGIGTASPARKLDLFSDVAGLSFEAGTGSPNSGVIRFGDNTGWKFHFGRSRDSVGGALNSGTSGVLMTIQDNGNVGIGTVNPSYKLDVAGVVSSSTGGFRFPDGTVQLTAASGVGGGTITGVTAGTGLTGGGTSGTVTLTNNDKGSDQFIFKNVANVAGTTQFSAASNNDAVRFAGTGGTTVSFDTGTKKITIDSSGITSSQWTTSGGNISYASGNIGIGTATPDAKLEVVGNINVTGTGNITAAGTIEGGNIKAKYQDVAEWVESSQELPTGTLVVLDHTKSNQVIASSQAYDTRVAGVVSAQPGITLGEGGNNKVLVATTGRVRLTVDASKGPIQIGDLLVTSDIPGVAMKSEAINIGTVQIHRPGTLVGKALEPLAKGQGKILVLLSLQ